MSLPSLMIELDIAVVTAMSASKKMLHCCANTNFQIFRRWCDQEDGEVGGILEDGGGG
jgi:hypothetical protein